MMLTCFPQATSRVYLRAFFFFFNDAPPTQIYTLSLHDALPISTLRRSAMKLLAFIVLELALAAPAFAQGPAANARSEEHTSELQSLRHLVCRLLLEKKKIKSSSYSTTSRVETERQNLDRASTSG